FDAGLALPSFMTKLAAVPAVSRWERWQARRLIDDVANIRRDAVRAALSVPSADGSASSRVHTWLGERERGIARFERLAGQLGGAGTDAHSVAALAIRALADLI
ncbi:MAG: hypothetical protein M3N98_03245, partial [Actinomycetota bacterium]|nr:hypothetical protein [Actinomycetota bacterium]